MARLCEGGNEPSGSLKAICKLREYFEKERANGEPLLPVTKMVDRVCDALKVEKQPLKVKKLRKTQPLVFTVERAEAGGGNRDATGNKDHDKNYDKDNKDHDKNYDKDNKDHDKDYDRQQEPL
ncbi:hypothetical protein ANN_16127 [Periplaneta americana]|uniref:Uncharacterized protein n=1 Tax=Periplaneta americana TaxID=6978 RepID=A0ABQ8SK24_PERAM|nr:hypothetical protein ANN_16127 [Periplaneta americana]